MKEWIVTEAEGERLDRWLAEREEGRTRNQIQHDIDSDRVRVGGVARPARYRVALGDRVEYDLPAGSEASAAVGLQPEAIPLNIVFEDDQLIVIDKPAGLVVHPAPGHVSGTVANALLAHCGPSLAGVGGEGRWGIVHRLDNLTSGLMMAAKTPAAYETLVAALAERRVRRQYLGIAIGTFKDDHGTIDRPIGRRPNDRKRMGIVADGREARTDWRLLCQDEGLALLTLVLHTGRTHQIRVHLQSVGHPILSDPEYGWTKPRTLQEMSSQAVRTRVAAVWPNRQMLHASILSFAHPADPGRELRFQSPPPDDMRHVMDAVYGESWRAPLERWLAGEI